MTCVLLDKPREKSIWEKVLIDGKQYAPHFPMPDNGSAFYLDGLHDLTGCTVSFE